MVEADPLPNGRQVLVYLEDNEEGWALDDASSQQMREAMAEADKGDFVTPEEWGSVGVKTFHGARSAPGEAAHLEFPFQNPERPLFQKRPRLHRGSTP